MRWCVLILLMFFSITALCFPRDSTKVVERQKAKIERQKKRIEKKWDERTLEQKKADRRAIIFLVISAGVLVNSMAHRE